MDYQEIKRKIKNCRDILVGIVPSPEAQVQQITIALMYKFMDDMDKKEQEENDAPPMFFAGDFAKYSWTKLLAPQVGSQERMNLYAEAIEKMNENKGIPQLFRDVFKGAFLPYRNPETLSMFLKEINGFTYDNSENLGNAFELLLSIMGSQGDAGMFRTPRHIIDFIVDAVDPQKNEQICDPACGSAGFLISAYKHIMKANTKDKKGDLLLPEEKKKLIKNFVGYDISPDMVRLSKVNLYLHGFPSPTIFEYDTLSSEEKWDENFDVMLANPPFMSPSGGIRPHKRFSVQANRSEVLFVDYILEHLRPNGRAGIIVPEGIIFQSATAYKALRKLLIEDGLLAVVSLPAGVFNPYAGVKTSILLFDNGLAKKTKEILFLKIQNDGYGLGAQRREIDKNDLPLSLEIIKKYRAALKDRQKFELDAEQEKIAHIVSKEKISQSGDYNLTGNKYKESVEKVNKKWPLVELGEVCEIFNGSRPKGGAINKGILSIGGEHVNYDGSFKLDNKRYIPEEYFAKLKRGKLEIGDVLIVKDGATTGKVGYFNEQSPFKIAAVNEHVFILRVDKEKIDPFYLYQFLKSPKGNDEILKHKVGAAQGGINLSIKKIPIPLPPIEVQKEIVEQIEVKQKAIEAAKAVIDNLERERRYFGQSLRKIKDVEWVELGEVCENILSGGTPSTKVNEYWDGNIPWITSADIISLKEVKPRRFITREAIKDSATNLIPKNNIIVVTRVGLGKVLLNNIDLCISQDSQGLIINKTIIEPAFLLFVLSNEVQKFKDNSRGSTIQGVIKSQLSEIKIPLPPFETQKRLVAEMEEQEKIIEANKKLVGIMEQKISEVLSEI